jgi:MscS family membrane protein
LDTFDNLTQLLSDASSTTYALSILLGALAVSLLLRLLIARFKSRAERTELLWDNALAYSIEAPLQLLIWVIGAGTAVSLLSYNGDANGLHKVISPMRDVGVIISLAWFLIRFIKLTHRQYIDGKLVSGKVDRTAGDAIAKIARLTVFITAVLVAMQTLGFSIAGVLTFGGVGGVAVGFAAKDLLANFFGGMMIYLDRPFAVGDWVRSEDRAIEGMVEDIGWRMTIIRKFDSRPMYVPNSIFSTIVVENPSRMTHRRLTEKLGVRHEDASVIGAIVSQTQAYLENHPDIDPKQTIRVNFETLTPSSLDIVINCFTNIINLDQFSAMKQQILLHILSIINDNGAQSSVPITTLKIKENTAITAAK